MPPALGSLPLHGGPQRFPERCERPVAGAGLQLDEGARKPGDRIDLPAIDSWEDVVETVRSVQGVQKQRDFDALLMEFTENQMVFKVGWWMATYDNLCPVHDRVSPAVIQALKEAGIVQHYRKSSVSVDGNSREQEVPEMRVLDHSR